MLVEGQSVLCLLEGCLFLVVQEIPAPGVRF
jgi:hypothetical protein